VAKLWNTLLKHSTFFVNSTLGLSRIIFQRIIYSNGSSVRVLRKDNETEIYRGSKWTLQTLVKGNSSLTQFHFIRECH